MNKPQEVEQSLFLSKGSEYRALEIAAREDITYTSDLDAAWLAPAVLLESEGKVHFEEVFDKILFHLEMAYEKSISSLEDQGKVSRVAEELFYSQVVAVQNRIDVKARKSRAGIIETIKKSLALFKPTLKETILEFAKDDNVLGDFVTFLTEQWELKKDREYFYGQTANIYQKIIKSKCYNPDLGLVRNVFKAKKEGLLTYLVTSRNLTSAVSMTQYDSDAEELNESARIIHKALLIKNDWEGSLDFLRRIKDSKLDCFFELKRDAVAAYSIVLNGGIVSKEIFDKTSHISKKLTGGIFKFYVAYFTVPAILLLVFLVVFILNILKAPQMPDGFSAIMTYLFGIFISGVGWGILAGIGSLVILLIAIIASNIYSRLKISMKLSQWRKKVQSI